MALAESPGNESATALRNTAQPVQESVGDDPAIEARIAAIILGNSGVSADSPPLRVPP